MLGTLALIALIATGCAAPEEAKDDAGAPPNIIVVLLDDTGYSDLPPYGSEVSMPNVGRLAAGGVKFASLRRSARG